MKLPILYLLPLPLVPISLFLLLNNVLHLPHATLPDCPHVLLITKARHGSTWLLDSIEHCRYSHFEQTEPGLYGKRVYLDTELWHIHDSPLRNISVPGVLSYLTTNSLKVFPTTFENIPRIERLLTSVNSPVVVLRRTPQHACCSLQKAMRSGEWAKVKGQTEMDDGPCQCDGKCRDDCREWIRETENYFADVARVLHRSRVNTDWMWYEQIKDLPVITLRNAGCQVRNCNFADT